MAQQSDSSGGSRRYRREREVAVGAARQACRLCRAVRAGWAPLVGREQARGSQGSLSPAGGLASLSMAKRDQSPVTVADFGSQAVIGLALQAAFPADPVVGEEDADDLRRETHSELAASVVAHVQAVVPQADPDDVLAAIDRCGHAGGSGGRFWTVDPIDGTKGFLRNEQYAVALALIEDGQVVLGVLGCPNLPLDAREPDGRRGCVLVAVRGGGVFGQPLDGSAAQAWTPVRVSPVQDPSKAAFCESVEAEHSSHGDAAAVAAVLGVTVPPVRMDSQCKYAAVARGDAELYLRLPTRPGYAEKIWDHAAGSIIVQEAGGMVTDVHGRELHFGRGRTLEADAGVVASNGLLHDRVIAAIRQVGPSSLHG